MDCIFCKIINEEIESYKIYEDEKTIAILDINPIEKGHILVIPKEHYKFFLTIPVDELKEILKTTYKIKKFLEKKFETPFVIHIANGTIAGQRIDHAIIQLVPKTEDKFNLERNIENDKAILEQIKKEIQ